MWNRRNKWTHDAKLVLVRILVENVWTLLFYLATTQSIPLHHPPYTYSLVWSCPPPGAIKTNIDASFISTTSSSSIGVVARDSFGLVLNTCAHILSSAYSAETSKACAFARGIAMTVVNNWSNAIIECDSILIFKRLRSDTAKNSIAAAHLVTSRDHLHHHPSLMVWHVGREANRVAHTLYALILLFID
ncbi:hypothetical protein V6N12_064990 [Hibiscus sabdariffa]|uniref:RNase H type-1 domain-containing protein n=1 Tax=Hibiscus sabdariffa TaxID=183260 RepID=A0ABR2G887_9ROSI